MALTVEDGTGVASAESYCTLAFATAYWGARTQAALYTTWNASTDPKREGALREACAYIDATWGPRFRGVRRGTVQGLLFPRTDAIDDAGYPLPGLPAELKAAAAELAARALSATLFTDVKAGGGAIKRVKAGSVEVEYDSLKTVEKTYPAIDRMLSPLCVAAGGWYFGAACE